MPKAGEPLIHTKRNFNETFFSSSLFWWTFRVHIYRVDAPVLGPLTFASIWFADSTVPMLGLGHFRLQNHNKNRWSH